MATGNKSLTDADYERAAAQLGVDEAAVRAIVSVEAKGSGFLPTGEPKILFERHHFSRLTGGRFDATHPDISFPKWIPGTYGPESTQHSRLARAAALDRNAALQSTSWGAFQLMGFNWRKCGARSLQAFVNAMYAGPGEQLEAALNLIQANKPMLRALRTHDWAGFALLYNGAGYRANRYDTKLAEAWARYEAKS